MTEPVKRYNLRQNMPATATTFLPDVVVSATDYARLEQECERLSDELNNMRISWGLMQSEREAALKQVEGLRAIINSALEQFPFNADMQKFTFNGKEVTADGDDWFYSVNRVNAFLCEVHDALSAKP